MFVSTGPFSLATHASVTSSTSSIYPTTLMSRSLMSDTRALVVSTSWNRRARYPDVSVHQSHGRRMSWWLRYPMTLAFSKIFISGCPQVKCLRLSTTRMFRLLVTFQAARTRTAQLPVAGGGGRQARSRHRPSALARRA